jgi:bifunctional non-homologous end joining protein LigD
MTVWDTGKYETLHWNDHKVEVVFHGARARGKYVFLNRHDPEDEKDWTLRRLDPAEDGHEDAPEFLEPMTAVAGELPADDDEWAYEFAWDGDRTMLLVCGGRVTLHDGTGADVTGRYPELHKLGEALGSTEVLLDGEVVVVKDGKPSPDGLEERRRADGAAAKRLKAHCPVFYFATDLLHLDGKATLELPYTGRRELLDRLAVTDRHWQVPRYFRGGGEAVVGASRQHGLPGVVAKRADGPYLPGDDSGDWLLIRN